MRKKFRFYKPWIGAAILWAAVLASPITSQAQAGRQISLSPLDLSGYPEIMVNFDAYERDGGVIGNLGEEQVSLRENGLEMDLLDFQALSPGIQLVAAFNISPPFAIQDINGNSRFDFIKQGLLNWLDQPLESSLDDLSILSNDGLELTHLDDKEDFIAALEAYNPNLRETQSNFNVLARAIEIASDPVASPGMKKVVLLISSQPTADETTALQSLLSQASDNGVRLYSLLVSSPAFFTSAGAIQLQNLSQATGGQFLPFSGEELLVDFGQLFSPLRSTYLIKYRSQIVTPGTHNLELSVTTSLGVSVGQRDFALDIQPPNPIFVSPPRTITRQIDQSGEGEGETNQFLPEAVNLKVLVEFPDRHLRDLEELLFRVDGEVVDRKTAPPYDQFVWDLKDYQTSAVHYLTLEAVDVMGLNRISLQTPIQIIVEVPPPELGEILKKNALALGGLGAILLLGIALFFLIARGRIHPSPDALGSRKRGRPAASSPAVMIRRMVPVKRRAGSSRDEGPEIRMKPFRLVPANDLARQLFPEPIRVTESEVILGSSPGERGITVRHESVIQEHARISAIPGGKHLLSDCGSPAGTWTNYQQIPSTKAKTLKDGDIIHIGEAGFRYQLLESIIPERNAQETSK